MIIGSGQALLAGCLISGDPTLSIIDSAIGDDIWHPLRQVKISKNAQDRVRQLPLFGGLRETARKAFAVANI